MELTMLAFYILGTFAFANGAGGGAGGHGSEKSGIQGELDSWARVSYTGDHFIQEGMPFSVACNLTLFDQLKWTLNGKAIILFETNGYKVAELPAPQGFIGSRLSVAHSRKDQAGDYKCTTFSPLSHVIYILSAEEGAGIDCSIIPDIKVREQCTKHQNGRWHSGSSDTTKLVRIGYPMPLECKITTEANAKLYKWFKDGDLITQDHERYKVFNDNATLLIPLAAQEDVGVYRCQAASKSFEISVVYLTYKNLPKSLTVLEGDKLSISCDVEGNPMPKITWYKNGANVEEVVNTTRYSLEPNEKGTDNATFLIEEAIYDDRAEYGCFITSGDLQFNTTTFVRVKDMYAALWPFLGICVEVFILCLIIFIYEKRRAKADFEESDTDQPPEQKNTPDLNKDSIRHRK